MRKLQENRYRASFVNFIQSLDWHWMITVGIGSCPPDVTLIERLRIIEASFCKKYCSAKYHKLAFDDRYSMLACFEGEQASGNRHAHILVHVPAPTRLPLSHSLAIMRFKWDFWLLWLKFGCDRNADGPYGIESAHLSHMRDGDDEAATYTQTKLPIKIDRIGLGPGRVPKYYAVKRVSIGEIPSSDFQFVTPPKATQFENTNTKEIYSKHRKAVLKLNRYEQQLGLLSVG